MTEPDTGGGGEKQMTVGSIVDVLGVDKELLHNVGTKGLLKLLVASFYVCNNRFSRIKVRNFIRHMQDPKFCGVQEALYSLVLDSMSNRDGYVATTSSSKTALEYLKWITWIGKSSKKLSPVYYRLLAVLLSRIQCPRLERSAKQKVHSLCRSLGKESFSEMFNEIFATGNLVAVSMLVQYLQSQGTVFGTLGKNGLPPKAQILDLYVKECIMTKSAKSEWFLDKASKNIFPIVDEDDCKATLIPSIQKGMLRSPEIAAGAVACCLKWVQVDLSPFAVDLGKAIGSCLQSKEDPTREYARAASVTLAGHMNVAGILKIVEWYLDIYNGAEGKLTVSAHKINILKTIEDIGSVVVKTADFSTFKTTDFDAKFVINRGVKILETEVHEGTLVQAIKMISSWEPIIAVAGATTDLVSFFAKSFPNMKGNVRTAACGLISADSVSIGVSTKEQLLELCVKTYEKSYTQITQTNGLTECISIAEILLSTGIFHEKYSLLESFWTLLPHINEKYVTSCSPEYILQAGRVILRMIENPPMGDSQIAHDALALLFVAKDYQMRKELLSEMGSVFHECVNSDEINPMLKGFKNVFAENLIPDKTQSQILLKFSDCISSKLKDRDGKYLALEFLSVCHHCSQQDLWVRVVQNIGQDPATVIDVMKYPVDQLIKGFDGSDNMRAVLKTLAFIGRYNVVSPMVDEFIKIFEEPEIMKVSRDDYFVFLTPENQLYDTSVIDASDETGKNMKRESRVYSYKEQLEEIQLRKELEEKRRQSGKPVIYSAKQKEAIRVQTAKEKLIRDNVSTLHQLVVKGIGLLQCAWEGNADVCGLYIKDWITKLVELMRSPLSAPESVKFFVLVGQSLFHRGIRGDTIIQISLRLIKPTCDLDSGWQKCPLQNVTRQTLAYILDEFRKDDELSGAKFAYSFPMLQLALERYSKDVSICTSVLQIILTVSKDGPGTLLGSTTLLPRLEVMKLLYRVIGCKDGTVQQLAVSSVLQLTRIVADPVHIVIIDQAELSLHLSSLTEPSKLSRETGMRCLNILCPLLKMNTLDPSFVHELIANVYRERLDSSTDVVTIAEDTWQKAQFKVEDGLHRALYDAALHPCDEVRHSASKAFAAFLKTHPTLIESTIESLIVAYQDYIIPTPALLDNLGRLLQDEIDRWEQRCGIGLAIREIAKEMSPETAKMCMEWLVSISLSDHSPAVHNIMLEAAVEIVQVHGTVCLNEFISTIETFLEKAGSSGKYDNVRQACVVLMGSLGRHLNPTDTRVKSIFTTLIDTLSTPSEQVQEAVANCLPALVPAIIADSESVLKRLLEKVMNAENFGERRGAAFGIAGMIKGLGILSLKQHDIMNILAKGMQDKKNYKHREGALMCLELLCEFLGRLFEPYIVHVLPYLLQCLGDSNVYVREATENTSKRVMSRLSAHGVKLVLPSLIGALNEDSWRTKCGSVELLGRMAYCAPKQLSGCLPMIVPRLIEVLGDSHVKVQDAGAKALGLIGSVIQNPEIQSVVPVLLEALQDPGKRSTSCLQCLLQTEFVHFVDPPSLALIMPVVQRAFQDRSTENRKMACQVIGNMYSLTDHSDLAPYMENVMPGIRASLVDPVPEVRAVAAKALGSMAKGMGDKCYDELLPWLMKTLVSEANSVDRSGAAQGLAEVIGSLGEDKLHRFMPEIIRKADCDDLAPHVRDGYMMMFIYMPGVFETEFVTYIGQIINPILKALADENEFVRETALRAGQRIVTGFAETAITLLLPELEKGIFDDNWRIRFSSIQLLGDLLYKISGVSGKMSTESAGDDDNFGTEQSQSTIISVLGGERRNRVLAGLYMGRSDVALMVRQAALHVWKVVVANTPKTLREILPTLFSLLLGCLASSSHDKRQVAARTLGDLVRKLGEKILPEIIPILEKGLESKRADERQGVCIGLSEIMSSTSRDMVLAFVDNLVPTLRKALCDTCPKVREAAAKTFGSLHSTVGSRALDEIVPFLMKKLNDPAQEEYALDGLGQILVVKSKVVMPYLIPQLTSSPVNTKALSILASVAGDSLSRHWGKIIPALLSVLTETAGTPREQEELEFCQRIILTVVDEQGVRLFIDDLLSHLKTEKTGLRRATVTLLSLFCIHTKADIEPYMSQLVRGLFPLMTDTDDVILNLVADGLAAIIKGLDSAEKLAYVGEIRQAVRFVQGDLHGKPLLPGLCTSKGISPVLPIFREALLNGSADVKEQAAIGMGELIALSSDVALKPSVIHITGPLIRILGDRYGPTVKVAVLDTLTLLLMKVGIHLKAFFPQLQTTFMKAASDPNPTVRLKAASALAQLTPIHKRPNPVIADLAPKKDAVAE